MAADEGNQVVSVRFHRPVDSYIVNERHRGIHTPGIYSGGRITIVDGPTGAVSLSVLVCEIEGDNGAGGTYQVKVEMTTAVNKTLSVANPYLVLRWAYTGVEATDFMEILATAAPATNDLVVGYGTFSGPTLIGINYSTRTKPDDIRFFCKVLPTDTSSSSVRILSGYAIGANVIPIAVTDQTIDLGAYSAGQTVAVYLTDSGGVSSSRIDVTAASVAGRAILAFVVIPVGGIIIASSITDARAFLSQPAVPDNVTIERDSSGLLQIKANGVDSNEIAPNSVGILELDSIFGTWVVSYSRGVTYLAGSDLIVCAYGGWDADGYTDANQSLVDAQSTSVRRARNTNSSNAPSIGGITFPVRRGHYWRVNGVFSPDDIVIHVMPIG
jgi:hypothetical protein